MTLAFSGDVLLHMPVNDRAAAYGATTGTPFDFRPMFDPLRPVLEPADLALCHLEVPVAPDGRLTSYPSFGAPAQVVDGIAHGGFGEEGVNPGDVVADVGVAAPAVKGAAR